MDLFMFVDSDHAGIQHTWRSSSGFFIYLNTVLISGYSNRQSTIETCTFGAKFVAMKTGVEALWWIRCKLCMIGIPIDGATHIYGDSMSVINNTLKPKSILNMLSHSMWVSSNGWIPYCTCWWWCKSHWFIDKGLMRWKEEVHSI